MYFTAVSNFANCKNLCSYKKLYSCENLCSFKNICSCKLLNSCKNFAAVTTSAAARISTAVSNFVNCKNPCSCENLCSFKNLCSCKNLYSSKCRRSALNTKKTREMHFFSVCRYGKIIHLSVQHQTNALKMHLQMQRIMHSFLHAIGASHFCCIQ